MSARTVIAADVLVAAFEARADDWFHGNHGRLVPVTPESEQP